MLDRAVKKRRKRHDLTRNPDRSIRGNSRCIETLRLFDNYRLLPFNWLHKLVDARGDYRGHRKQCSHMVQAGLLGRMTFDGSKRTDETMTYWRTEHGDRFLHQKGYEGLPHDGTHDAHQVLTDLIDAQMQIGSRDSGTTFLNWSQILEQPAFPTQPPFPFRFPVGANPQTRKTLYLVPDGRPFILKHGERSALFLKELDRNNENPEVIKNKVRNYLRAIDAIKDQYKRRAVMVLFVTTNPTRLMNLKRWTEQVCQGPSQLFLFGYMEDHIRTRRSTAPVVTDLFDRPVERAGVCPYLLRTLSEV
jgi:hypothetical protein